jgi:hypothetical protein
MHKIDPPSLIQPLRLLIKTISLFACLNLFFGLINPVPAMGAISAYNLLFPGRVRLPYGDAPQLSYNLSLYNLPAMFASHELHDRPKATDEFRVIFIGDSSIWGFLLPPDETTSAWLNYFDQSISDGRRLRAYNLGYPVMSVMKDLLILSRALRYQPDLIVWAVTLESLPYDKQLFPPLLQNNPKSVIDLANQLNLQLDTHALPDPSSNIWQRSLVAQRRELADIVRLQAYGVMWAATGIDQYIPSEVTARLEDLPADQTFHNLNQPLKAEQLAFDVLQAGYRLVGEVPILLVNEPMFISSGQNSDIRYNFFYPRWAYDAYRSLLADFATQQGWPYLDAWDAIDPGEFTNTAIHMTPRGAQQFARIINKKITELGKISQHR